MTDTVSIVETWPVAKINPPRPRSLVSRPRLLAPINTAALAGRVILLVAPGGSGKTSLLADWARQAPVPIAWYALDPADRDMQRLALGICAAVERVAPGRAYQARQAIVNGASEVAAIGLLLGALEDLPLTLVLDDFHLLDDLPEATALWEHLFRFRPPTLSLVILSRSVPLLGFAMLAAMDALLGLGRTDLGFDGSEAADLLAAHGLDTQQAAQYAARSDGWATGVLLFARAAPGGMRFLHTRQDVLMEQLGGQVLAPLPATLRRFLLESAALGPVTASEADAILHRHDSASLFAEALARDLFIAQEKESGTYRYHDLFAEYFTRMLQAEDRACLRQIRQRAAEWWQEHGNLPRALEMIAAAEDWPALAGMLESERRTLWERRLWGTILDYAERLPPVHRTARVLALCGHARAEQGQYAEALAFADAGKGVASDDVEWLSPAVLHAEVLVKAGRYQEAIASADAALAVAQRTSVEAICTMLRVTRGWARLRLGEFDSGKADLMEALAAYQAAGDVWGEGRTLHNLATQLVEAGHVLEAEGYLSRASMIWLQEKNHSMLGHLNDSWAMLHALTGDLPAARARAEQAVAQAQANGDPLLECDATATLSEVLADAGDTLEADRQATAAAEMADRLGLSSAFHAALRARIAAALGRRDRAGARKLLDEARPLASTPVDNALLDLFDGLAALRSRAHARAIELLGRAAERLVAVNRDHSAARAHLLRAEALLASGVTGRAEEALNRMASLILPLGCEPYLWPVARITRQTIAERHLLRRLRRDTRQLLDRLAEAAPALSVVAPAGEQDGQHAPLRLSPFGQGQIVLGDRQISSGALPPKARELLFFAGHMRKPLTRAQLLEALWEDDPRAPQDLWDASRHIRRLLGERSWVLHTGSYSLNLQVIDDSHLFKQDALIALGQGPSMQRLSAAERALELVGTGGYLEWCDSLWAATERAQVNHRAMEVALGLAHLYDGLGRAENAITACRRAIAFETLDEAPRLVLIRMLAAHERVSAALQEYKQYRRLVREELGGEPSVELRQLAAGLGRKA